MGFRDLLRAHGFTCERDGTEHGDLRHDVPGIHFEVKRCETLSLPKWIRQAASDAKDKLPVIAYRRSRETWRVDLEAEEYLSLKAFEREVWEVHGIGRVAREDAA